MSIELKVWGLKTSSDKKEGRTLFKASFKCTLFDDLINGIITIMQSSGYKLEWEKSIHNAFIPYVKMEFSVPIYGEYIEPLQQLSFQENVYSKIIALTEIRIFIDYRNKVRRYYPRSLTPLINPLEFLKHELNPMSLAEGLGND